MTIRDPDKLEATIHAVQKMKERNIGGVELRKSIEEGIVTETNPVRNIEDTKLKEEMEQAIAEGATREDTVPSLKKYRLEIPGVDLLTIVDPVRMKIVTTFWDDAQGATGGRL